MPLVKIADSVGRKPHRMCDHLGLHSNWTHDLTLDLSSISTYISSIVKLWPTCVERMRSAKSLRILVEIGFQSKLEFDIIVPAR